MKNILSAIALIILISSSVSAQNFDFHRISLPIVNGDTSTTIPTVTYGTLTNNASTNQRFKLIRILNNLPPTWISQMCFGQCFGSEIDTIYPYPFDAILMTPGETDTLSIDVFGSTIGTGTIVIKAFNVTNPDQYIVDTFKVHLSAPNAIIGNSSIVNGYELRQNYPNPFNPSTVINFSIPKSQKVTLKVYNILGNEVATLLNNRQLSAGNYDYEFDANAYKLATGLYIYKLTTENFTDTKKMVLSK